MASRQDEINALLAQFSHLPELSIVKLSEPILSRGNGEEELLLEPHHPQNEYQRSSDVSTGGNGDHPTPASLQADLEHYKELFTKLRFSYVEQVTKERFLRFVVGDPPVYVTEQENAGVESRLFEAKQTLKAQKSYVEDMIADLEQQARHLTAQQLEIQRQAELLRRLPEEIDQFRKAIADLAAVQEPLVDNPLLSLPLQDTVDALSQREEELAALDAQVAALEEADTNRSLELSKLEWELNQLQTQKNRAVSAASEARQRKEQGLGSMGDELEEKGRWLRGVESTMTSLLQVDA